MTIAVVGCRLRNLSAHVVPCVTTYSADGRATIKRLSGRISAATAGCGKGAQCGDELGRLGAEVASGCDLPDWVAGV